VGGAILVDNPTLIQDTNTLFNALCFLQYEMESENAKNLIPRQWEVCVYKCVYHRYECVSVWCVCICSVCVHVSVSVFCESDVCQGVCVCACFLYVSVSKFRCERINK